MKAAIIMIVLLVLGIYAFSQDSSSSVVNIHLLVEDSLADNEELIIKEAKNLSQAELFDVYSDLSYEGDDIAIPFVLNTFLGFGIGSFVQGDNLGGGIGLGLDLLAFGVGGVGAAYWFVSGVTLVPSIINDVSGSNTPTLDDSIRYGQIAGYLFLSYAVIYVGSKVFQMVRPWTYASAYNDDLKNILGVRDIAFNAFPLLDIETGSPQVAVSVAIKL